MNKEKILVVDDDESVVEYLQTALELAQYDVRSDTSSSKALALLRSTPGGFPVILSDIMMPEMDGLEMLRIIRKEFPETLVVMLTAHASMESAIRALNEGAFAYLRKPVDLGELKASIKNAFEKYHLVQENKRLVEELNKAKEYTETIVQNLVYTVVATDSDGYIRKINRAMENILGYKEEELVGKPLDIIFSEEFRRTSWTDLISKRYVKDFAVIFRTKDGRAVEASFSGTIMKNDHGQMLGFLGTAVV